MKVKKGILAAVLMGIGLLTGCSYEETLIINKDLSATGTVTCYTTQAEEDDLVKQMGGETTYEEMMTGTGFVYEGTEMINGVPNSKYSFSQKMDKTETKKSFIELTTQKAVLDVSAESENQSEYASGSSSLSVQDMDSCRLVIKYPFKVAKTNGKVQSDGYTVVYDIKKMQKSKVQRAYALNASALSKSNTVTIKGVKNKKAYKKQVTVKVSSKGVITSFTVNGKAQQTNSYSAKKDGRYKVVVKTASGQKKTLTFYVDGTKPTTNIKNKKTYNKPVKITFKDKTSGIKSATLNGKKIKSGKKVSKNGSYTLKITDKAGNVRTVKFTIQK